MTHGPFLWPALWVAFNAAAAGVAFALGEDALAAACSVNKFMGRLCRILDRELRKMVESERKKRSRRAAGAFISGLGTCSIRSSISATTSCGVSTLRTEAENSRRGRELKGEIE